MGLTKEYLLERFEYRDGELFYRKTYNNMMAGRKAGSKKGNAVGYYTLSVNYKVYTIHRLVFLMHHGYLPATIDHIDGNKLNNKIENLRPVTRSQNGHNMKLMPSNISGSKGVSWYSPYKKWRATININYKQHHLGYFSNVELAKEAAEFAREFFLGEFANHGNGCVKVLGLAQMSSLE